MQVYGLSYALFAFVTLVLAAPVQECKCDQNTDGRAVQKIDVVEQCTKSQETIKQVAEVIKNTVVVNGNSVISAHEIDQYSSQVSYSFQQCQVAIQETQKTDITIIDIQKLNNIKQALKGCVVNVKSAVTALANSGQKDAAKLFVSGFKQSASETVKTYKQTKEQVQQLSQGSTSVVIN